MRFFVFILSSQLFIGTPAWAEKPVEFSAYQNIVYTNTASTNTANLNTAATSSAGINSPGLNSAGVTSGLGNEVYIGGAIAAAGLMAVLFASQGKKGGATPALDAVDTSRGTDRSQTVNTLTEWGSGAARVEVETISPLTINDQGDYVSGRAPSPLINNGFRKNDVVLVQAAGGQAQGRVRGRSLDGMMFLPAIPSFGAPTTRHGGGHYDYTPREGQSPAVPILPKANDNHWQPPVETSDGGVIGRRITDIAKDCRERFQDAPRRNSTERGGTPGLESEAGRNRGYNGFQWRGTIQPDNSITSDGPPTPMFEGGGAGSFDECMKQGLKQGLRRPF